MHAWHTSIAHELWSRAFVIYGRKPLRDLCVVCSLLVAFDRVATGTLLALRYHQRCSVSVSDLFSLSNAPEVAKAVAAISESAALRSQSRITCTDINGRHHR
jgi:hypothetical protein